MNNVVLKLEQVSDSLSLQQLGVILSIIQSVFIFALATLNKINPLDWQAINIVFIVTGTIIIILSGALGLAIKQIFSVFKVCTIYFPQYFLDLFFGGCMGLFIALIITQMPIIPCLYHYIRNR